MIRKPRPDTPKTSNPPDTNQYGTAILAKWGEMFPDEWDGKRPVALGARLRASWAGRCSRAISYDLLGVEPAPFTLGTRWVFSLGQHVHEQLQASALALYPNAKEEVDISLASLGIDGAAHADLLIDDGAYAVLVEAKSINGTGFKTATGRANRGRAAEGPRVSAYLQGAMMAEAHSRNVGYDTELVILVVGMESISVGMAAKDGLDDLSRFVAEWRYPRSEYQAAAVAEAERLGQILWAVDMAGAPVVAQVPYATPEGAEIDNPAKSTWSVWESHDGGSRFLIDRGALWNGTYCDYCSHQATCVKDMGDDPA